MALNLENLTPWAKGQSGNPSGRAKLSREVRDARHYSRKHTEAAVAALAEIMADGSAKTADRIAAAELLLLRGWGPPKPAEPPEPDGGPDFTIDQLERALAPAEPGEH